MFFVFYRTNEFEPEILQECETIEETTTLLNQWAHLPDFKFRVIEGKEVKFKPVQVVKAYAPE